MIEIEIIKFRILRSYKSNLIVRSSCGTWRENETDLFGFSSCRFDS